MKKRADWQTDINANAKSLQSCPTLCDPIDGSPPGSPVPGILQARTPEWVSISFSNARKWKVKVKSLSRVWLLATPWAAAYQAPPSMGFSGQEYWSGVPLPSLDRYQEQCKLHNGARWWKFGGKYTRAGWNMVGKWIRGRLWKIRLTDLDFKSSWESLYNFKQCFWRWVLSRLHEEF